MDEKFPTRDDLILALCNYLDGTPNHHINSSELGMTEADCEHLVKVRNAVKPRWLELLDILEKRNG